MDTVFWAISMTSEFLLQHDLEAQLGLLVL